MNEQSEVMRVEPTALESIERAMIDVQISTAKKFPRDIALVKRGIESMATLDQETAEACFYTLPRSGKTIQGPGVRMAEIAVHQFGNIRVQTRVIDTVIDGPAPHVTVQSACMDLEKNVGVSIEKRRRIVGKRSNNGRIDEDDINLATNACAAIAFRDAAFKVIPQALIKPAYEAAKRVAIGDAKTLADRRAAAFARFAKMGVDEKRVLLTLQKSALDAVDLSDLETLYGLFTSIKEGTTSLDEAFPRAEAPAKGVDGLAAKLAGKTEAAGKEPEQAPKPEDAPPAAARAERKKKAAAPVEPAAAATPEPAAQEPPAGDTKPEPEDNIPMGEAAGAGAGGVVPKLAQLQEYAKSLEAKLPRGPIRRARTPAGIPLDADLSTITDEAALERLVAKYEAGE